MSQQKKLFRTRIRQWLTEKENKTVLNQIIVNFLDKLVFATLAAFLAFWFNFQLGKQSLIGDYQKEIFIRRQNGYIEVLNQIQAVDRSLALHMAGDTFDSNRTRLLLKNLEAQARGFSSGEDPDHQEALIDVLKELDELISITENYEIYFPDIFIEKINMYTINLMKAVDENEKQIKLLRDNQITTEEFRDGKAIKLAALVKLRNEINSLIRTRLRIEGIILG